MGLQTLMYSGARRLASIGDILSFYATHLYLVQTPLKIEIFQKFLSWSLEGNFKMPSGQKIKNPAPYPQIFCPNYNILEFQRSGLRGAGTLKLVFEHL